MDWIIIALLVVIIMLLLHLASHAIGSFNWTWSAANALNQIQLNQGKIMEKLLEMEKRDA